LSYERGFVYLREHNIPFVRINGSGAYYPQDWKLYLSNKKEYFRRLDEVIYSAEKNHIKIVFTFFWRYTTIPKLMREKISAYNDVQSKTMKFIIKYVKEIVKRYKDSPAILGWELGNEYNLKINIGFKHLKKFFPDRKDHIKENIFHLVELNNLMKHFRYTIRMIDKNHFISTGNSIFRTYIYGKINKHNYKDMVEKILVEENKYADVYSLHLYPWTMKKRKFFCFFNKDIYNFLSFIKEISEKTKKKIFIGEFGFCKIKNLKKKYTLFKEYLRTFNRLEIPYAALWVYDRKVDTSCNISNFDFDFLNKISF